MKRKDSLARKAMKLLCTLLGILLVVLLSGTLVFRHFLSQIQYTDPQPVGQRNVADILCAIPLHTSDSTQIGGPGSGLLNILLIGQDAREGESQARSDSMILCTYHKQNGTLTMTSFLRDLYVPIPGHGSNRINAAYSLGGASLLKKTLDHNFHLYIDGTVEVDFTHFAEIIDHMGGVEIDLRQDEADVINQQTGSSIGAGIQRLDGLQALTYARIRSLDRDGDFSRTNRQRKVISTLLDSFRDMKITELTPVLKEILPMIRTDLNQGKILLTALEILPRMSELELRSQRIPADGTFTDKNIDGMWILAADIAAQQKHLRNTLME